MGRELDIQSTQSTAPVGIQDPEHEEAAEGSIWETAIRVCQEAQDYLQQSAESFEAHLQTAQADRMRIHQLNEQLKQRKGFLDKIASVMERSFLWVKNNFKWIIIFAGVLIGLKATSLIVDIIKIVK
ncbi:MAG: hypothetical protein WC371_04000 [Parachlamydiales bacterium]|jgi:hypothetical protein